MMLLYIRYKKKSEIYSVTSDQLKTDTKNSEAIWESVFKKIGQQPDAHKLYKELKILSHPDKFPNDDKKIRIANEISSLLGEKMSDLEKLQELRERINQELLNV